MSTLRTTCGTTLRIPKKFIRALISYINKIKMLPYFRLKFWPKIVLFVAVSFSYVFIFSSILQNTDRENYTRQVNRNGSGVIAVLVLVCDRFTVERTLKQIFKYKPSSDNFPVVLSHDCDSRGTRVEEFIRRIYGGNITYIMHPNYKKTEARLVKEKVPVHMQGYHHIAVHYGWALNYTFNTLKFKNVVIIEDDLDISPDFFEYFEATLPLLYEDPTLWCVSGYNDNGQKIVIDMSATDLLYRTDFFPGLGWMMTEMLWKELMLKWPNGFWDDWMRDSNQRKNRACIHPEISRTKTFGRHGVSNGQFFDYYLQTIELNTEFVPFTTKNMEYLLQAEYDKRFLERAHSGKKCSTLHCLDKNISKSVNPNDVFQLVYRGFNEFASFASKIGIMTDLKDGVPRSSYKQIVPVMYRDRRVYLTPSS